MENNKNIIIGENAGLYLTSENHQLCVKCDELGVDINKTMTENEYELISNILKVISFYNIKNISNISR